MTSHVTVKTRENLKICKVRQQETGSSKNMLQSVLRMTKRVLTQEQETDKHSEKRNYNR